MSELKYKILIIAPYFAPYIGVGAARITSLSEYLSNNGWDVTVVCFDPQSYSVAEQKRRVPCNVNCIYFEKTSRWERSLWLKVQEILSMGKIDICLHTVGPFDFMKKIYKVRRLFGVPYVIDCRDPWLLEKCEPLPNLSSTIRIKIALKRLMDIPVAKNVVRYSAAIVCVTAKQTQDTKDYYHLDGKVKTIQNGYETGINVREPVFIKSRYSIVAAGKMAYYNFLHSKNLVNVVNKLRNEGIDISIYHIGKPEEKMVSYCENNGIHNKTYIFCGEKSYEEVMGAIERANIGYIAYSHQVGIGTKIYDYIAKNKPVIYAGVVPSELADFVSSFENGFVANDMSSLERIIRKIINENIECLDNNISVNYSRNYQNRRYAELLKGIIQNSESDEEVR